MDRHATLGSLAVAALIMASDAASRGILTEKTWQAYVRLVEKIKACKGDERPILARLGNSLTERRRLSVAIEQEPAELRVKIRTSAVALIDAMKSDALRGCLGVSLRRLEAMRNRLEAL